MKSIRLFLRATFTGGILFLLPVVLLIVVVNKAHLILLKISAPLAKRLPSLILGLDGSMVIAILLLVILCFVSGLLFRSRRVKRWIGTIEDSLLSFLPGYAMIKSITADVVGEKFEEGLQPIFIKDGDVLNIGFLVEEGNGLCTVFIPDAPRHDAGEVKIVPASMVKKVNEASNIASKSLKNYGKGAIAWIKE